MNIGKVVIVVLVVLVLYVMHKYQNNILLFLKSSLHTPEQTPKPIVKKENKSKKEKKVRIKDKDINMDNISQVSIGSLEDNTIDPYQADPMLNSMESNNTIGSLLDG